MTKGTYRVCKNFLCLECVDKPHGNVADEEEGDGLARWLAALLLREVDSTSGHISDEQQLEDHLKFYTNWKD